MGFFDRFRIGSSKRLFEAAKQFDVETVRRLLDKGADVHARDKDGETPLHRLAGAGVTNPKQLITSNVPERDEIARLLLAHGAKVNDRDHDGETPLHKAAEGGNIGMVGLLLELGADVNARDNWGRVPLLPACFFGRVEIVDLLLKHGADPNSRDKAGQTPTTAARGDEHVLALLRERGAAA